MNCYRVTMRDDYAGLYDAESEQEAREKAIAAATESIKGAAMSDRERRAAVTVAKVQLRR